ncbi:arginase family protein [Actinomadura kijaniata]|uniref:Arginase n=1 Tax=Actinomadura namibiensis TaxID=182080 RepID=A0A7W3LKK9_ACTNM|nr:arginase family protein [Actinomadura namibiensis]MBA8949830.1 arginase [Actinomadura namibiensis]
MTTTTVLEIPQWQASASPTARRLTEGAGLLAGLFPDADHVRVPIADEPGTAAAVRSADVLRRNLAAVRESLAAIPDDTLLVTVGGDCAVDLAPVERAHARYGDRLALVWLDAHGDLNTPASSPSKAFHGMILRALLGEGPADLLPARPLSPSRVVLAGARALDAGERAFLDAGPLRHLPPAALTPEALAAAVADTGAEAVYLHLDLDVLDPGTFASVGTPEPGGLTPEALSAAVQALAGGFALAGMAITEYEPRSPEDQKTLETLAGTFLP